MDYDVVVVGCGPAGALAGRAAASVGARTLMVDKKIEIGSPIHCTGGAGGLWLYAKRLNLELDPRCVAQEIKKFVIYSPSGKATPPVEAQCTNVYRDVFDRSLVEHAIKAGAHVMLNTRVIGLIKKDDVVKGVIARHEGETINIGAKVVIGADKGSIVARSAGLGERTHAVLFIGYEFYGVDGQDPEVFYSYFGNAFAPLGHAVHGPRGKNRAYLGTGAPLDYFTEGKGKTLRHYFNELLKHPVVKEFFKNAQPTAYQCGPGWACAPLEKTVAPGVMLAGDAAGQLWAAQGGGITPAMVCGNFAGQVAAKAALEGDVSEKRLKEYEDEVRSTIGRTFDYHIAARDAIGKIVSSDTLIEKAVQEIGLELVGTYVYATDEYRKPVEEWLKSKV